MAKVVIAGRSDCPYFARVELLGDRLVKNLPSFELHKITKTPEEWQTWLQQTCAHRGWQHQQSPIVWRELIDRGGKGVLIGGASDFQEYVKGYYGLESKLVSDDMRKIAAENLNLKKEVDSENAQYKALSKPLLVCITGADSPTCYSVISSLASGEVLGGSTEITLRLYDNQAADFGHIQGVAMEALDLCEGLVRGIEVVKESKPAFADCSVIVFLDELLKEEDESHEKWIERNSELFTLYGKEINQVARKNVRVLVAGNGPVNFNTMTLINNAPKIPRQNIVGLTRTVENRAKAVIGQRLNVNTAGVVDLIVWGNVNGKRLIDNSKSRVHGFDGAIWGPPSYSVPVLEMVHDNKWMEKEYLELVEHRQHSVEHALGHSSSGSTARAISSMLTHWFAGSPLGQMFSLAVYSEGWYGVPEGLVFSFPVTLSPKGYWIVVQDIDLSDDSKHKIQEAVKELQGEREVMHPSSRPPSTADEATNAPEPSVEGVESAEAKAEAAEDTKADEPTTQEDVTPKADTEEVEGTKPQTEAAAETEGVKSEAEGIKTEAEDSKEEPPSQPAGEDTEQP